MTEPYVWTRVQVCHHLQEGGRISAPGSAVQILEGTASNLAKRTAPFTHQHVADGVEGLLEGSCVVSSNCNITRACKYLVITKYTNAYRLASLFSADEH